jgi:hypothetical protein
LGITQEHQHLTSLELGCNALGDAGVAVLLTGLKGRRRASSSHNPRGSPAGTPQPTEALDRVAWLGAVPLLQKLSAPELQRVADGLREVEVAAGEAIITAGERGDAMYFLEHGRAQAEVRVRGEIMVLIIIRTD